MCIRDRGHRVLVLGDNLAVMCSLCKSRAADWGLLGLCRVSSSISLAANLRVNPRWIPSEHNPADGPSRRFEPASFLSLPVNVQDGAPCTSALAAKSNRMLKPGRRKLASRPFGMSPAEFIQLQSSSGQKAWRRD
eukprot:1881258-Prorocentrum_lima.AAC.1